MNNPVVVERDDMRALYEAVIQSDDEGLAGHAEPMIRVAAILAAQPAEAEGAEVLARGYFHALPEEDDYEFWDEKQGVGQACPGCVPAMIVTAAALSVVTAERDQLRAEVQAFRTALRMSADSLKRLAIESELRAASL